MIFNLSAVEKVLVSLVLLGLQSVLQLLVVQLGSHILPGDIQTLHRAVRSVHSEYIHVFLQSLLIQVDGRHFLLECHEMAGGFGEGVFQGGVLEELVEHQGARGALALATDHQVIELLAFGLVLVV